MFSSHIWGSWALLSCQRKNPRIYADYQSTPLLFCQFQILWRCAINLPGFWEAKLRKIFYPNPKIITATILWSAHFAQLFSQYLPRHYVVLLSYRKEAWYFISKLLIKFNTNTCDFNLLWWLQIIKHSCL